MALRERERFIKLIDQDLDECKPGESGWLATDETEEGEAVFEMTTNPKLTLETISEWVEEKWGHDCNFMIEAEGGRYRMLLDGKPLVFDQVMWIVNNFR